jgi:hypothetical protein
MKWLYAMFNIKHVHCYSDKKHYCEYRDGSTLVVMACNKCGLEQVHVFKRGEPV